MKTYFTGLICPVVVILLSSCSDDALNSGQSTIKESSSALANVPSDDGSASGQGIEGDSNEDGSLQHEELTLKPISFGFNLMLNGPMHFDNLSPIKSDGLAQITALTGPTFDPAVPAGTSTYTGTAPNHPVRKADIFLVLDNTITMQSEILGVEAKNGTRSGGLIAGFANHFFPILDGIDWRIRIVPMVAMDRPPPFGLKFNNACMDTLAERDKFIFASTETTSNPRLRFKNLLTMIGNQLPTGANFVEEGIHQTKLALNCPKTAAYPEGWVRNNSTIAIFFVTNSQNCGASGWPASCIKEGNYKTNNLLNGDPAFLGAAVEAATAPYSRSWGGVVPGLLPAKAYGLLRLNPNLDGPNGLCRINNPDGSSRQYLSVINESHQHDSVPPQIINWVPNNNDYVRGPVGELCINRFDFSDLFVSMANDIVLSFPNQIEFNQINLAGSSPLPPDLGKVRISFNGGRSQTTGTFHEQSNAITFDTPVDGETDINISYDITTPGFLNRKYIVPANLNVKSIHSVTVRGPNGQRSLVVDETGNSGYWFNGTSLQINDPALTIGETIDWTYLDKEPLMNFPINLENTSQSIGDLRVNKLPIDTNQHQYSIDWSVQPALITFTPPLAVGSSFSYNYPVDTKGLNISVPSGTQVVSVVYESVSQCPKDKINQASTTDALGNIKLSLTCTDEDPNKGIAASVIFVPNVSFISDLNKKIISLIASSKNVSIKCSSPDGEIEASLIAFEGSSQVKFSADYYKSIPLNRFSPSADTKVAYRIQCVITPKK